MLNTTQEEFVINQLKEKGYITRNECLRNFISRLGAIMCKLKKEGYEFDTKTVGGDYVYTLKTKPMLMDFTRDLKKEELDKMLNKCLLETKISWSNSERIDSIKEALKSNNLIFKRNIICLYYNKSQKA